MQSQREWYDAIQKLAADDPDVVSIEVIPGQDRGFPVIIPVGLRIVTTMSTFVVRVHTAAHRVRRPPAMKEVKVMVPEGHTVSLTYDESGTIVYLETRNSAMGEGIASAILSDTHHGAGDIAPGRFVQLTDVQEDATAYMPDWVGPFLDSLGAPKQQPAVAALIEG